MVGEHLDLVRADSAQYCRLDCETLDSGLTDTDAIVVFNHQYVTQGKRSRLDPIKSFDFNNVTWLNTILLAARCDDRKAHSWFRKWMYWVTQGGFESLMQTTTTRASYQRLGD
jgi:hypothetical protein